MSRAPTSAPASAPASAWSNRRAAVRAEAEAERRAAIADDQARVEARLADKSDQDILQELSLQDPDQMQPGDDFAAFMRDEVPQRLRKRALRTLWRSNPVLACVDDLVDYGDDFKAEWTVGEVIKTTYQVGKGMLAHVQEMERQKAAEELAAAQDDGEPDATPEETAEDPGLIAADEGVSEPDFEPELAPEQGEEPTRPAIMPRMRFDFDEVS